MNIKQLVSSVCSLCAVIAVSACNDAPPVGDLIVPFEIGAGIECSLKDVQDVEVTLFELKGAVASDVVVESTKVPCAEGEARFDNLPVGNYAVRAEGYDADDFVVVDNDPNAAVVVGEVLEGKESTLSPAINMSSTPAKLWVRYELNKDGFQTMCSQIKMTQLSITAYKDEGSTPLLDATLACDAAPTEAMQYHYLADPGRDLDGTDFDFVRIQPLDATGNKTGLDVKFPLAEVPGAGRTVKLTFSAECDDTKCDLKCSGDACTQD